MLPLQVAYVTFSGSLSIATIALLLPVSMLLFSPTVVVPLSLVVPDLMFVSLFAQHDLVQQHIIANRPVMTAASAQNSPMVMIDLYMSLCLDSVSSCPLCLLSSMIPSSTMSLRLYMVIFLSFVVFFLCFPSRLIFSSCPSSILMIVVVVIFVAGVAVVVVVGTGVALVLAVAGVAVVVVVGAVVVLVLAVAVVIIGAGVAVVVVGAGVALVLAVADLSLVKL
jgi:hypothetical protein